MSVFKQSVAAVTLAVGIAIANGSNAQAQAPNGYPITNVNLRAGPGTQYPVILTVPSHAPIAILGCLPDYTWCDSVFQNYRGWMRSIYLSGYYDGGYYLLRDYAPDLGYRPVTFNITAYWDSYYRDRPFYRDRARWAGPRADGWVDDAVFYDRLSPYGSWTWIQGQYVWVPAGVDRGWRPYTRGRWVYTARGWTWVSNEPYGWATYHYGRWGFSDRIGWFWVPGNRWAPAWVSWRQSNDYLAWAPLPPEPNRGGISINISFGNVPDYYWSVVPSRNFLSDDLPRYYIDDRARRRPLIERARPIGNTTIIKNNVTINKVVNVKYVEQKTKKKVVERKITRTANAEQAGKVEGDTVEVFEPTLEETGKALAPPEPRPVEEVAAASETKSQAEGEKTTEEMLAPPEVEQAVKKRKGKKTAGGDTPATLDPTLPKGEEKDTPPPQAKVSKEEPVSAEEIKTPAAGETKPSETMPEETPPANVKEEKTPQEAKPDTPPAAKTEETPAPKPKADEASPAGAEKTSDEPKPKAKEDKGDQSNQKAKGKEDGKAKDGGKVTEPKDVPEPPAKKESEPKQTPPQDSKDGGKPDDAGAPKPEEKAPSDVAPDPGPPPEPKPEQKEAPPPKADHNASGGQDERAPAKPKETKKAPEKAKEPPPDTKPNADKPKSSDGDKSHGKPTGAPNKKDDQGPGPKEPNAKPKPPEPPKQHGNGAPGANGPQDPEAAGPPPKKKQDDDKKRHDDEKKKKSQGPN